MNKHHSLMIWAECQKLFASLFQNPVEYGAKWPNKLGLSELAAMQTIDRPQARDGWLNVLAHSGDSLQVENIMLTRNTGFGEVERVIAFVTPQNFANYLKFINEQPSRLVAAWLEAFEIEHGRESDELDAILSDASLHDTLNGLNKRNEAPYDGVLGCPPDSITENERERFKSIRNRLLDGEGFTEADIRGLINDCSANSHSFSLIPDRLKQDIRFLASLWRAAKQDKPKAEAIEDGGLDRKENTNDIAASSLLKLPSRQDAWVDVISDMATAFYAEFSKLPNESQAWGQLWKNPPAGYVITTGKDKGEDCLNMPGEKPLSKSGFSKRWKSYTDNNTQ